MATLEELVVSLVAETSGLRAELDKATKATKDATSKMDDAIKSFTDNSSKNVGFWQTALASATGFLAADATKMVLGFAKDALGTLVTQLEEGARAAIAEEQANVRLANSLALSGKYSKDAMLGLQQFSSAMETATGVADDVVSSNLAMLSSLTRLDAEGLKVAQKAALDFSAATGKDLETSTQMIAKAINGSTDSFKKMGITIQESNDKTTNFNNTMRALNGFAGSAEGAAKTFGGAVLGLSNAWGNLTESLATAITKNPVVIAMMQELTKIISSLTGESENASVALQQGVGKALIEVAGVIAQVVAQVDAFVRIFQAGLQTMILPLNAISGAIAYIGDALGIVKDADPFSRLKETASALNQTIMGESALGTLANTMLDIKDAGVMAFTDIKSASEAVTPTVKTQKGAVQELDATYKELLTSFATGLAQQGQALDNHFQYENELRQLNLENSLALEQSFIDQKTALLEEDFAARQENLAAQQEAEWAQLELANQNKLMSHAQYEAAKTALSQKQFLDTKKLEVEKTKFESDNQKTREANLASSLNTIATLQSSSSKELMAIGKAAAIAQATIDGIAAVQKALSAAPPPFNFALAALVGVAAAANVAKIAGVGLNEGGTIAGGGANVDTVAANLTKGETVVSRELTDKLDNFLNNQGQGEQRVVIELRSKEGFVEWIEAQILERRAAGISLIEA